MLAILTETKRLMMITKNCGAYQKEEPNTVTYCPLNIDNWLRINVLLINPCINICDIWSFRNYTETHHDRHVQEPKHNCITRNNQ